MQYTHLVSNVTRGIMIKISDMRMLIKSGVEVIQRVSEACWVYARVSILNIHDDSFGKKNGIDGTMWRVMSNAERSYFLLGVQFGVIEASEWILVRGLGEVGINDAAKILDDIQKEMDGVIKGGDHIAAAKYTQMMLSKLQRHLNNNTTAKKILFKADQYSNQLD